MFHAKTVGAARETCGDGNVGRAKIAGVATVDIARAWDVTVSPLLRGYTILRSVVLYDHLVFTPCRYEVIDEAKAVFPDPRMLTVLFLYEIPSLNGGNVIISLVHPITGTRSTAIGHLFLSLFVLPLSQ